MISDLRDLANADGLGLLSVHGGVSYLLVEYLLVEGVSVVELSTESAALAAPLGFAFGEQLAASLVAPDTTGGVRAGVSLIEAGAIEATGG